MTISKICPFCQKELEIYTYNQWRHSGISKEEQIARCMQIDCKNTNPQKIPSWVLDFRIPDQVITYYQACMSHQDKHYILQASTVGFTRLYYNDPGYGALIKAPLMEVPYMLKLSEPYSECLKEYLNKMIGYLLYI